jgi:hypothetical protein
LLRQLTSSDLTEQHDARQALLAMDEDTVDPLIAEFYAGVNEAVGVVILDLVGEIGGPDALLLLKNVYYDPGQRPAWREASRNGLLHNRDNLNPDELAKLL